MARTCGHSSLTTRSRSSTRTCSSPRVRGCNLRRCWPAPSAGAELLEWQRYDIHQAVEQEDEVVLRLTWTGMVARDAGPFTKGQELRAHIVQFIRTRDGRIREIETYDCFEPVQAPATPL